MREHYLVLQRVIVLVIVLVLNLKVSNDLLTINIGVLLGSKCLPWFVDKRTAARRKYDVFCHNASQENIQIPENRSIRLLVKCS